MTNLEEGVLRKHVLSIDGGGFRGLACLITLHHLMRMLTNPDGTIPLPCQVFDLICGTSTGGLIAILLGRLGLDCITALSVYKALAPSLFEEEVLKKKANGGRVEPTAFEEKFADIVEKYTGAKDTLMKVPKASRDTIDHESTDTFVTTVQSTGAVGAEPYRLRSYPTPAGSVDSIPGHNWTIFEAARAASSLPFLKPFTIASQYTFQDASTSNVANPVSEAISEVELRWTNKVEPVIISLGTGLVSFTPINPNLKFEPEQRRGLFSGLLRILKQKPSKTMAWSDEFAKQLARVAQDTEMAHQGVMERFMRMDRANNYFRFNPTAGLGDISFSDIAQAARIMEFTNVWLGSPEGRNIAERAYTALRPPTTSFSRTESDYESDDDDEL